MAHEVIEVYGSRYVVSHDAAAIVRALKEMNFKLDRIVKIMEYESTVLASEPITEEEDEKILKLLKQQEKKHKKCSQK